MHGCTYTSILSKKEDGYRNQKLPWLHVTRTSEKEKKEKQKEKEEKEEDQRKSEWEKKEES